MKKFQFKQKRHMVTAVCLLIGVMVLTTSVYANYDNASGYSNFKSAAKHLMLDVNNVTADLEVGVYVDGELFNSAILSGKFGDNGYSVSEIGVDKDGLHSEDREYQTDDTYIYYNVDDNTYRSRESQFDPKINFLGIDKDDKTNQKLIRFLEVGADMVVGDLKNNVVLTGEDDEILEYKIDVSKNQMPEIIDAGLSLMFGTINSDSNREGIYYANWDDTFAGFIKSEYGVDFENNPYDDEGEYVPELGGYDTLEEYRDARTEYNEAFWEYYDGIYEDDYDYEGILYISDDGSYTHYENYYEYKSAEKNVGDIDDVYYLLGEEPYIENAKGTARISKDGELRYAYLEVTMAGHDASGAKHTVSIKCESNLSDYGTTVPDEFDPTGKVKLN